MCGGGTHYIHFFAISKCPRHWTVYYMTIITWRHSSLFIHTLKVSDRFCIILNYVHVGWTEVFFMPHLPSWMTYKKHGIPI